MRGDAGLADHPAGVAAVKGAVGMYLAMWSCVAAAAAVLLAMSGDTTGALVAMTSSAACALAYGLVWR